MKRAIFILGLWILFGVRAVAMQENSGTPWPPDPATIFAPNVEVLSVVSNEPEIRVDEATHEIAVRDGFNWETFSYPETFTHVDTSTAKVPNGQIFLFVHEQASKEYTYWTLDPQSGGITPYAPCPGMVMDDQIDGSFMNSWLYAVDPNTRIIYFCNQETGFVREVPENLLELISRWAEITPSPQGDWLLLAFHTGQPTFYGYEIATGQYHVLGSIVLPDDISGYTGMVEDWLDDTRALYWHHAWTRYIGDSGYYAMDVTVPNSLRLLIDTPTYWFMGHPPRLEWVIAGQFELYFRDTDERRLYTLGTGINGIGTLDDVHYYAVATGANLTDPSRLIMLNIETGEQTVLFTGEIEMLQSLSQRYAVLITGSNGQIDLEDDETWSSFLWNFAGQLAVTFYDLQRGVVVYQAPHCFFTASPIYEREFPTVLRDYFSRGEAVVWIDSNTALITSSHDSTERNLLQFTDNGVVETSLEGVAGIIRADRQILLGGSNYSGFGVVADSHVYDVATGQTIPIFADPFPSDLYQGYAFNGYGDHLTVELSLEGTPTRSLTYTVRVKP